MVEKKLFLQIWSINIVYPNVENIIAMPVTKRILWVPKFVFFHRWALIMRKMVEGMLFLQIQSINIVYPNMKNMIAMPLAKRMEIVMGVHVCLISRMNFNYKEIGERNAFLVNPKYQYHVSQCGEHDWWANNKNRGDYYKYQRLSYFTNQL